MSRSTRDLSQRTNLKGMSVLGNIGAIIVIVGAIFAAFVFLEDRYVHKQHLQYDLDSIKKKIITIGQDYFERQIKEVETKIAAQEKIIADETEKQKEAMASDLQEIEGNIKLANDKLEILNPLLNNLKQRKKEIME